MAQILSLELLYSVLHNCGSALRTSDRFILAIKQDLCESLLKNFVSSMTEVLSLSLKVFVALVTHFKVSAACLPPAAVCYSMAPPPAHWLLSHCVRRVACRITSSPRSTCS